MSRNTRLATACRSAYPVDLFRLYQTSPEFLRLALWEGLEFGSEVDEDTFQRRVDHYRQKVDAIRQAQQAGTVDPSLDPQHLMIVLLGMSNYWFAVPQIVRLIFQREPDAETYAAHERFLAECCRRILTPPAENAEADRSERLKTLIDEIAVMLRGPQIMATTATEQPDQPTTDK